MEIQSRIEMLKKQYALKIKFVEKRVIPENSVGHSYESIFAKCLCDDVTSVRVEDAYISQHYQLRSHVINMKE